MASPHINTPSTTNSATTMSVTRHDWSYAEIAALYEQPFNDLLFQAQSVHRENFEPNTVQVSTLLSIKTGACPEDCKYCSQSNRYDTGLEKEQLLEVERVIDEAKKAKEAGSTRFCMGAAWRSPKDRDMSVILEMVKGVKALGLESCMTLGMLTEQQASQLAEVGLDYYNHNLDTSEAYYKQVITTRTYQQRLDTLASVRNAGIKVCCGGILGMGEHSQDRIGFLQQLANLPQHPESVPINMLVKIEGTPLDAALEENALDPFDFIRCIAVARILMPQSYVRLSAGRQEMNEQMQALAFFAGANSIFYGEKLLTTENPETEQDLELFKRLGIQPEALQLNAEQAHTMTQEDNIADTGMAAAQPAQKLFYNAAT